ncbi:response regulator [Lignipirellula cremea]|uniref:response regulator n=1 Tax=Lignipirellula cremea TaxID=2528010 RepID=UPI001E628713|nr:response regulator [Lignipirellula cremea]
MSVKPKILFVRNTTAPADIPQPIGESFEVVEVQTPLQALMHLNQEPFFGVYFDVRNSDQRNRLSHPLQHAQTLDALPDGVALLDADNTIVWANRRLHEWSDGANPEGSNFYAALGSPEILGPDFCPFHTVLATGSSSSSTLRLNESRYFQIHAAAVLEEGGAAQHLIVTVRDVTTEMLQQQKLTAIHKAGQELADLTPDEVLGMTVEDRIELLKSNILHYTQDLLNFDVVEVRLLDQQQGRLEPLLSVGIDDDAANRKLFAQTLGNGVTGFVAATGKSYLCEDTTEDPLYIEGFQGARSSLTVPLMLHDQVIGTFNVESPDIRAFSESDLQFLEIFSRDVAVALNTLELLVAQSANVAQASVEAIHSAVALPVDEILNDAVNTMERYIGHEPEVVERLKRILRNARDIKRMIQKVGEKMAPSQAVLASSQIDERPKLRGRRVLVADADEDVRQHAHALLERYGCVVETAHDAEETLCMVRNSHADHAYDAIISDIGLPDMSGSQLYRRLQKMMDPTPMVLMTGFGYDPGHSIVKARQAGLHPKAILYKPFRLDQLLETVETVIEEVGNVTKA